MQDADVIDAYVEARSSSDLPGIQVESRPDEENRDSPDIDAIAGPLAIEHTSFDSLLNQRRDSAWYLQVVEDLEREIPPTGYRLNITLPYDGIATGQDWPALQTILREWILVEAPALADGAVRDVEIPGIPFAIAVRKDSSASPGLFFARSSPTDGSLESRLREALLRKGEKLIPYAESGKTRVLLLENSDLALMNDSVLSAALSAVFAQGEIPGIDQLWFADTSIPAELRFEDFSGCMRAGAAEQATMLSTFSMRVQASTPTDLARSR